MNINTDTITKLIKLNDNIKLADDLLYMKADLNNSLFLEFSKTYKLIDYKFESSGSIKDAKFLFKDPIKNFLSNENIKEIFLKNSKLSFNLNLKKKETFISGKYSFNNKDF